MENVQTIGVDVSSGKDASAVASFCQNCGSLIYCKTIEIKDNKLNFPIDLVCPTCKYQYKKIIIVRE